MKQQPDNTSKSSITLAFVGDICLGAGVCEGMRHRGPGYPFEHLKSMLADADIRIGNLECCFTDDTKLSHGQLKMTVPSPLSHGLKHHSNFDIFGLANNHIMDGGHQGLTTTLAVLKREAIAYFGAGQNRADAERPLFYDHGGKRFAFIGACDASRFEARPGYPGVAPWNDDRLLVAVRNAREQADLVTVILHGDLEFTPHPQPARVRLSRQLADAGADLVIQHHPHVVQGQERYGNSLIAYSLGNCIFQVSGNPYQESHPGTDIGYALITRIDFSRQQPQIDIQTRPYRLGREHRPEPLEYTSKQQWLKQFNRISQTLAAPGELELAWHLRCRAEARRRFGDIYWAARRGKARWVLHELAHILRSKEERRWLFGFAAGLWRQWGSPPRFQEK